MDFSELAKHSGLAAFSPDGQLLASTDQNRVIVRNAESLDVVRSYTCLDGVNELSWSPDSGYLLAAQLKRKIVQVFSIADPQWTCKIDEALAGLTHACWAPDSRHILIRSEFNLRLSIWSLVRKAVTYIRTPKLMSTPNGTAEEAALGGHGAVKFSHAGTLMAVLSRVECKDVLSIYSVGSSESAAAVPTGGWELLKQFHIDTEDCVQIEWAPNDAHILCVDTPLQYNVAVYTPSGQKLAGYRAYEHALGVKPDKGVAWSPANSFLAVGSYDQQVRIFNNATWSLVHSYVHSSAAVNGIAASGGGAAAAAAARVKASNSSMVLYAEKPLNPNHVLSRLAADSAQQPTEKENNPLDESSAVDASFAGGAEGVARPGASAAAAAAAKKKPTTAATGVKGKTSGASTARPGSAATKPKSASAALSSGSLTARGGARSGGVGGSLMNSTLSSTTISSSLEVEKSSIVVPSKYTIESLPVSLPSIVPSLERPDPKLGVGLALWSHDERYLLSRNDNMPSVMWVWDTQRLALAALMVQMEAVRAAAWDPRRSRFALACATPKLYLWSPEGCSIVDVPLQAGQTFNVRKLEWSHDGRCILLMDKAKFCCCYMRD